MLSQLHIRKFRVAGWSEKKLLKGRALKRGLGFLEVGEFTLWLAISK